MEHYKFILRSGDAATIVRLTASGVIHACLCVTHWVNSRPGLLEGINYISVEHTKTGKALIHIPPEDIEKLRVKAR